MTSHYYLDFQPGDLFTWKSEITGDQHFLIVISEIDDKVSYLMPEDGFFRQNRRNFIDDNVNLKVIRVGKCK